MKFTFVVGGFQPFSCFWAQMRGFPSLWGCLNVEKKFEMENLCEHTVRKKKELNSQLHPHRLLSHHFHIFCTHNFSTLCSLFNPTVNTFFFHSSFRLYLLLLFARVFLFSFSVGRFFPGFFHHSAIDESSSEFQLYVPSFVSLVRWKSSSTQHTKKSVTCTMNFNFTLHFVESYFQFNRKIALLGTVEEL